MSTHVFNPNGADELTLPRVYCFCNGCNGMGWIGVMIAADGTSLGSHCSSSEGWLVHDLGIGEASFFKSRRERFATHYPDGYVAEWVSYAEAGKHVGLKSAYAAREAAAVAT